MTLPAPERASRTRPLLQWLTALAVMLCTATLHANPIPIGSSERSISVDDISIDVYTYKPANYSGGPILLVLHGLGANAPGYRNSAIPLADARGFRLDRASAHPSLLTDDPALPAPSGPTPGPGPGSGNKTLHFDPIRDGSPGSPPSRARCVASDA